VGYAHPVFTVSDRPSLWSRTRVLSVVLICQVGCSLLDVCRRGDGRTRNNRSADPNDCDSQRRWSTTDFFNLVYSQRSHDFSPVDDLTHSHSLIHNPCNRDGIRFPGTPLIVHDGSRATHPRTRPSGRPVNPSPNSWGLFAPRSCLKHFHGVSLELICRTCRPPPAPLLAGTRPSPPPGGSPGGGRRRDG